MASDGNGRGGLLSAGGILSIIVGAFEIIVGGLIAALTTLSIPFWPQWFSLFPRFGDGFITRPNLMVVIIIGVVLAVLGIVAIVGGISAIKRKSFGLSLAGAICALLPINFLGIFAVIFVSLGRGEFVTAE